VPQRVFASRYTLHEPLGRGAVGQVWRAWDERKGRTVAVKLIQVGEIGNPAYVADTIARFEREVAAVSRVRQPNIVTAYEAGRVGDELFLVMELADGTSLSQVVELRQSRGLGPLPVPDVLSVAEHVSAGLAAAHDAGIVHRDIKPSNLMVCSDRQVKIIDFGVARLLDDGSPRLTRQGQAVGTLAYMSPEQLEAGDLDGRSDLYSLGCVLYELLAGRRPFIADLPEALIMQHLYSQPTPLREIRPEVPVELETIVSDLMAKDKRARPASAEEVRRRLAPIRAQAEQAESQRLTAYEPDAKSEGGRATVLVPDPNLAAPQPAADAPVATQESGRATVLADAPVPSPVGSGTAGPSATPATPGPSTKPVTAAVRFGPGLPGGAVPPLVPDWTRPAPPPKRRSRRWVSVLSTFLTLAIIAAVGVILWLRMHEVFKVTSVAVAPAAAPGNKCNVTVDVVGTIVTNGHGGQVTYQWIRNGNLTSPVSTAVVASGQTTAPLHLSWSFKGKGTYQATAQLRVLSPEVASATTTFTYSCR
jgi:eukaryotic-like serine/threonine-protein kinase